MSKIKKIFNNPYILLAKIIKGKVKWMDDKLYLNILYHASFGKNIDWKNPVTYNEKLQWLKIYDRNPLYTTLVDKFEVKHYVEQLIGKKHIIPTIDVWDSFDEIDFSKLPRSFVLKCTHDSGGVVIVQNKEELDISEARTKINRYLKRNYYWQVREWPYKKVKPRIIAEEYLDVTNSNGNNDLRDYKFFCFDGVPKFLYIASDRNVPGKEVKFDYYDITFTKMNMSQATHPTSNYQIERPENYDEMVEIVTQLCKGFKQVRIDLYIVNNKIYFGEYTFFNQGGMVPFIPEIYDYEWGKLIKL